MTPKPKVIIDPHFRTMDEIFSPDDLQRLHDLVEVVWGRDEPMPHDAFLAELPTAEVVVSSMWGYGDVLEQAQKLRAIMTVSGAFPLDLNYERCYQQRIRILSAAPAFAKPVAEMAFAMALAASREVVLGDRAMRRGDEDYLHDGNRTTFMLYDQPVGFIGYGNLAHELHPLLQPFNVHIRAYDPWLGEGYLKRQGVEPASLEELMQTSKVVFVLAAPTKENQAMLSREILEMMPQGAVLVLVSRAHVVDFDAMTELASTGRIKVATDVFPTEPLAINHPIREAEHAVLSAHRAGPVREGLWIIGEMIVDDLEVVLRGLPPKRLQMAEPELSLRYAINTAKSPDEEN